MTREELLDLMLESEPISVRCMRCLRAAEVVTYRDLVKHHRSDMLKFRNFGKKSLMELDELLESKGLSWGMEV